MEKIRVVLADDQKLFVENLKIVLETCADDIEVVGIAYDGREVVECIEKKRPNIVLMDVRMPNMNGVEATRIICRNYPETRVMMLTTFDDDEYVHEALHSGAVGYQLKDIPLKELITSIRAIREGSILISPTIAAKLVRQVYHSAKQKNRFMDELHNGPIWLEGLSKREKEVLRFIAKGFDNKEIADRLFIAEQTVKNHVHVIYSKLGARDRIQAMKMVMDAKIDIDKD